MSMLVVLALLGRGRGLPVLTITDDSAASQAASCDDLRTRSSILWTCLVTVLSCTWVSIHPNVPGPDEKWLKVALRRVGLMVGTLIAPELIIAWAMRQRIAARRLAKRLEKAHGWTITHGFFAVMGGFMLFGGDDKPERTLLPDQLDGLSTSGEIGFPKITEEEVEDKGKGDILSKGLVILQTGWFVTQIVARKVQGLSITELEVATLAFAVLNFVIYGLWWHKPLDVKCAARVYKKQGSEITHVVEVNKLEEQGGSAGGDNGGVWAVCQRAGKAACGGLEDAMIAIKQRGCFDVWWFPFGEMMGFAAADKEDKRVGTFYAWDVTGKDVQTVVAAVGTVFGSIHLIGWSYAFPSHTEQLLWRVSSLAITCLPIVIWGAAVIYQSLNRSRGLLALVAKHTCRFSVTMGSTLYITSRVVLLVLPFLSLRSLPPDAYRTVSWTMLIPHLH